MSRHQVSRNTYQQIKVMLADGTKYRVIAKATGVSTATVGNVAHDRIAIDREPIPSIEAVLGPKQSGGPDPTPEEIAAACEKLRRYRPRHELAGMTHADIGWSPPIVGVSNFHL